jgi:hypothetical protein
MPSATLAVCRRVRWRSMVSRVSRVRSELTPYADSRVAVRLITESK